MVSNLSNLKAQPSLAFVFSGQGTKWPQTGRDLYERAAVFREVINEWDSLLTQYTDWSLIEEFRDTSAEARIHQTEVAQPAYCAFQVALTELWRSYGVEPDAAVGHSTGEIAAACAAGILTYGDAARVAYHRGKLMQEVTGLGKMIWVKLPPNLVKRYLIGWENKVSIAAHNEPTTTVLAGQTDAVEDFMVVLRDNKIWVKEIGFNYGFHCPLVDSLRPKLVDLLNGLKPKVGKIPVISTVTGTAATEASFDSKYWGENIRQPVLFVDAINVLIDQSYTVFVEISPHTLLLGSIDQCLEYRSREATTLPSLLRSRNDFEVMSESLLGLKDLGYTLTNQGVQLISKGI